MFVRIWRFHAAEGREAEFERVYGSDGGWARLFSRAPGFHSTELLRETDRLAQYLTIDRWQSRADWEAFRGSHVTEYRELDKECEALTSGETHVGDYEVVGAG